MLEDVKREITVEIQSSRRKCQNRFLKLIFNFNFSFHKFFLFDVYYSFHFKKYIFSFFLLFQLFLLHDFKMIHCLFLFEFTIVFTIIFHFSKLFFHHKFVVLYKTQISILVIFFSFSKQLKHHSLVNTKK